MNPLKAISMALLLVGVGVAGVFASRHVPVDVPEGEIASGGAKISAWADAAGLGFGLGAAMMIGGGVLARVARKKSSAEQRKANDSDSVLVLCGRIRECLVQIPEEGAKDRREKLKEKLDEVLEELVPKVLDQREAMIADMGLGDFAEMIGHFATMERNTARAWSALIDECESEIPPCIERAIAGLDRAIEALEKAT